MSKRGKKSTVEIVQVVERPFLDDPRVSQATQLSDRWAQRVETTTDSLKETQQTLQQLANALQTFERQRRAAEVQALYLAALNIQGLLEYRLDRENGLDGLEPTNRARGASVSNRKSSSRPASNSARRPGSGVKGKGAAGNGTDDAVATLLSAAAAATSDPKRKQRCVSALQQYFKAPYVALSPADIATTPAAEAPHDNSTTSTAADAATEAGAGATDASTPHSTTGSGSPLNAQKDSLTPRPTSASMGTVGSSQGMSMMDGGPLSATLTSGSGGPQPRRPREVPTPLWDEMTNLRRLYYTANERVTILARAITEQLQRFTVVRDNNEVACYAMEATQMVLKNAVSEAAAKATARQQAEAAAVVAETKARGASAGSRKTKKN